jgi:hypothetical protein
MKTPLIILTSFALFLALIPHSTAQNSDTTCALTEQNGVGTCHNDDDCDSICVIDTYMDGDIEWSACVCDSEGGGYSSGCCNLQFSTSGGFTVYQKTGN